MKGEKKMEGELQDILQAIGPQRLMMLIQVLAQMSQEQVQQLIQQLAQMVEQEQNPQAAAPGPDQGQANMYGM